MSQQPEDPTLNKNPIASSDATDVVRPPVATARRRLLAGGLAAAPLFYSAAARSGSADRHVVRERVTTASPLAQDALNSPSGVFSGNVSSPGASSMYAPGSSPDYWTENATGWGGTVASPSIDALQVDPATELSGSNSGSGDTGMATSCDPSVAAEPSLASSANPVSTIAPVPADPVLRGGRDKQKPGAGTSRPRDSGGSPTRSSTTSHSAGTRAATTTGTRGNGGADPRRVKIARVGRKDPAQLGATFKSVFGNDLGLTPIASDDCVDNAGAPRSVTIYEVLAFPDDVSNTTIDGIKLGRFARHVAGAYLNSVNVTKYPVRPEQVKAMWRDARTGAGYCPTGYCGTNVWYAKDVTAYLETTW
jgi:hypothetical protein